MLKNDLKKRNWTFELYNDSCAKDWEEYLVSTGIPFSYAYHDKDFTEIGQPKKPHYHVLICYDGPTTYHTVYELGERVGAANKVVQPVGSVRGIVRYFCHKDNADKHQYPESIIQCRNGFDPKDYFTLTITQQKEFKKQLIYFIKDNDIEQYSELVDTLLSSDEIELYDIATQNTFFITQYLKSRKEINRTKKERIKNDRTSNNI